MAESGNEPRGKIAPALVDEIRSRVDLVRLIGRATKLVREGHEHKGLCPFHKEKTPSFTVVPDRGFYHCFGCGAHGGAFDFVMETENLSFRDAVLAMADETGVQIPGERPPKRKKLAPVVAEPEDPRAVEERARRRRWRGYQIWCGGVPVAGTVAQTYLSDVRGIDPAVYVESRALRFAPEVQYWAKVDKQPVPIWTGPALLAVMQYPDGRFAACHVTYLQPDGSGKLELWETPEKQRKAKKCMGAPGGAAIRLGPPMPYMVAGEGLETTLSVMDAQTVSGWCAYSLDNLAGAGIKEAREVDPRDKRKKLPSRIPDMGRPGMLFPPDTEAATYLGDGDTKDLWALDCILARAVRRQVQLGTVAGLVEITASIADEQRKAACWLAEEIDGIKTASAAKVAELEEEIAGLKRDKAASDKQLAEHKLEVEKRFATNGYVHDVEERVTKRIDKAERTILEHLSERRDK